MRISPRRAGRSSPPRRAAHPAMFHPTFNVLNTLLFIGFVNRIERPVSLLIRGMTESDESEYRLEYLSTALQDTPELNLVRAQRRRSKKWRG